MTDIMNCMYLSNKGTKLCCTLWLPPMVRGVWEIDDNTLNEFCMTDNCLRCPKLAHELMTYTEYLEKNKQELV